MQEGWPYIKDFGEFIKKIHNLDSLHQNMIQLIGDMVGLHPSITHEVGLRALREALNKRDDKTIPIEKLLKMPDFALKQLFQIWQ